MKKRIYFYVVDVNGRLFLDDLKDLSIMKSTISSSSVKQYSKVRSIANALRDVKFLNQFYKRVKKNDDRDEATSSSIGMNDASEDDSDASGSNKSKALSYNQSSITIESEERASINTVKSKKSKRVFDESNIIIDPVVLDDYMKVLEIIKQGNEIGNKNRSIIDFYPFYSPCFGEMNLIRSEDENVTPIVFTDISPDSQAPHGYSMIMNHTTQLKQNFDPSSLIVCEASGKMYHTLDNHPHLSSPGAIGLIRSHLAQQLSSQFVSNPKSPSGLSFLHKMPNTKIETEHPIGMR